jgi:hypothetical protein
MPNVGIGSVAASGLRNLNDCFQSDPAGGARPRRFPIELAVPGPQAVTEFSWLADGKRSYDAAQDFFHQRLQCSNNGQPEEPLAKLVLQG